MQWIQIQRFQPLKLKLLICAQETSLWPKTSSQA